MSYQYNQSQPTNTAIDLNRTTDITTRYRRASDTTQCLIFIRSHVDWGQSASSSSAPLLRVSFLSTCCSFPLPGTLFLLAQPPFHTAIAHLTPDIWLGTTNSQLPSKVAERKCSLQTHPARQPVPIQGGESPRGLSRGQTADGPEFQGAIIF